MAGAQMAAGCACRLSQGGPGVGLDRGNGSGASARDLSTRTVRGADALLMYMICGTVAVLMRGFLDYRCGVGSRHVQSVVLVLLTVRVPSAVLTHTVCGTRAVLRHTVCGTRVVLTVRGTSAMLCVVNTTRPWYWFSSIMYGPRPLNYTDTYNLKSLLTV